jgi:hypothetical protein
MHTKRLIGLLLAAIGIMGVIYTAAVFTAGHQHHTVMRIVYISLGVILFVSGIRLVITDKEEA